MFLIMEEKLKTSLDSLLFSFCRPPDLFQFFPSFLLIFSIFVLFCFLEDALNYIACVYLSVCILFSDTHIYKFLLYYFNSYYFNFPRALSYSLILLLLNTTMKQEEIMDLLYLWRYSRFSNFFLFSALSPFDHFSAIIFPVKSFLQISGYS